MKFYINTLGCKVNTYESNVMRDLLINHGYIESEEDADVVVVNTCSVTNTADKKSLKTIHQMRRNYPNAILIVAGCMTQNKKEQILTQTDADIILGNQFKSKIIDYIEEYKKTHERCYDIQEMKKIPFEEMRLNNFNQTRAFVKIQDGCNNFCAYCVIPYVRGDVRSKDFNEVLEEVETLVKNGKKEIVLTGIHTGNYGRDLRTSLAKLLKALVKIEGLKRIRISSIEITELDAEFMEVLESEKIIVDHMHIPLQSGSDNILKAMNRKYDKAYFIEKIESLRKIRPNISITTDVIVGFPGETEEDFLECLETIEKVHFSKIHVFPYSKREGTKAAGLENQVDEKIKKERVKVLLKKSEELEKEYMQKFIGQVVEVLPEVKKENFLIGHTGNFLQIRYKGDEQDINNLVLVKIDTSHYPYLEASKLTEE